MERENFFVLLDLSIDPPESDPKVISEAISRKQLEWSRLRNHPTKGLAAQKYINMLPEIRRVMLDLPLRAVEAEKARALAAEGRVNKISALDSHIKILMGKGFVTKEEIAHLAESHGLSAAEVEERVRLCQQDKYAKIDQQIGLRMAKGYVTEQEIARIAKRHSMPVEDVRKRVRCPIRKEKEAVGDEAAVLTNQLDRSIKKVILENLKVVGKKSLYDFLGLPESADLKDLQEAAARKKKELSGMGRRDALVTSGNILVGQCMTIFKSDETRNAYDVSLARARLAEIDSDIDIAAMSGKVRPEYFRILVEKAVDFGMDADEAEAYIKNYCRQRGWSVELPPEKKRLYLVMAGGAGIIFLLLVILFFTFYTMHKHNVQKAEYQNVIAGVNAQKAIPARIRILKDYIRTHDNNSDFSDYVADARKRIHELKKQEAENEFDAAFKEISRHIESADYEGALIIAQNYLKKAEDKRFVDRVKKKVVDIRAMIEKRDYEALESILLNDSADKKIRALKAYLEKHPKGKHLKDVRRAIDSLAGEYYVFIVNHLKDLENEKNWKECARLCNDYIDLYDNAHSDQLKLMLDGYKEHIRQDAVFDALVDKAKGFGTDYDAAIRMYEDYLTAYPDTVLKDRINAQVEKLKALRHQADMKKARDEMIKLLEKTGGRFVAKGKDVVLDTKTGLMWTLLDSGTEGSGSCLTYEQAKAYVKHLSDGGYSDWRLPTPEELSGIYQKKPFFPRKKDTWYWSSKHYTRYSDGWHTIVEVVSSNPGSPVGRRDALECGFVRAVRKP